MTPKEQPTMKIHSRAVGYGALLVLMLTGGVAAASAAGTLPLGSSTQIPAAQGKVHLRKSQTVAYPAAPELLPLHYMSK